MEGHAVDGGPGRDFAGGWSWMTSVLFPGEFGITLVKSGAGTVINIGGLTLPDAESRAA